ncbi:CBS domain-containing protein [Streptomyces sp. NPDC101234]|uniref:CBS domain-containing protein n=1 Tax=Streptomyces sp. NPDC101234 TaxID=3366138 RepID=UPI0038192371
MDVAPTVVNDVMTHRVVALRTGAAFKDISGLPALDETGAVVGVVSEADLPPRQGYADVVELMTTHAVTVAPDATRAHAAHLMARRWVERLPVLGRHGTPKGSAPRYVHRGDPGRRARRCRHTGRAGPRNRPDTARRTALTRGSACGRRGVRAGDAGSGRRRRP